VSKIKTLKRRNVTYMKTNTFASAVSSVGKVEGAAASYLRTPHLS